MILMIDNYDSFTYNLVQYLAQMGRDVAVYRNDAIAVEAIGEMDVEAIFLSPGPCSPQEAGITVDVIRRFHQAIPILGVCLGHQAIGYAFGGGVVRAEKVMHGKTSQIQHDGKTIFAGLPNPFVATRYHSLTVKEDTLPDCLERTAWSADRNELMGVRHHEFTVEGVQFHPESFLTEVGHQLLTNFLALRSPRRG